MGRSQQLDYLINQLLPTTAIPPAKTDKWQLFRALVNMREPNPVSAQFLLAQDELLQSTIAENGVTDIDNLKPIQNNLFLWRGDITTLRVGAIVNAANSGMLGCFIPNHTCIDNAIHTFAGVQLRLECAAIMEEQGYPEPTGQAKITAAYNLPSKFILHTVGPIITGKVRDIDRQLLASCYRSCLEMAENYDIQSVAFCCISTGEFHYPNEDAALVATETVSRYLKEKNSDMKVVFNVFTQRDEQIYKRILG